ncbi:MAG: site-2 protease family protein [Victivallaceae bacterium]
MDAFLNYLGVAGSVLFVVFFFGMCVFVHELGHFLVAKWRGLHIVAFSLGFRKAWGKKINGVEYRIGWIPAGGYVDLPQIDTTDTPHDENGNILPPAKPLDRLLTAAAGPLFNVLFGLLLGCVIWIWGMPQETPDMKEITVDSIIVDSPEYRAGLRPGDVIVKLNGHSFDLPWNRFSKEILLTVGQVDLEVRRDGELRHIVYTPEPNPYVRADLRREKLGVPFFTPKDQLTVSVMSGYPAAAAGMRDGDTILSADGFPVDNVSELSMILASGKGAPVNLEVRRADGGMAELSVTPQKRGDGAFAAGFLTDDGKVVYVLKYSPAEQAGLKRNDKLLSVNGIPIEKSDEIDKLIDSGDPLSIEAMRGENKQEMKMTPLRVGGYMIGVTPRYYVYPSPFRQFYDVIEMTWDSLRSIGFSLGNKMNLTDKTTTVSARNLSGPVGIFTVMYKSVNHSLLTGVFLVVFISFALAIFNILPLPVLDGGHVTLALIEMVTRRPVPKAVVKGLSMVFVGLLFGGMFAVTVLDLMRFVPAPAPEKEPVMVSIDDPVPPPAAQPEPEAKNAP